MAEGEEGGGGGASPLRHRPRDLGASQAGTVLEVPLPAALARLPPRRGVIAVRGRAKGPSGNCGLPIGGGAEAAQRQQEADVLHVAEAEAAMCDGGQGGCGEVPLLRERPRGRCDSKCIKCKDGSPVVIIRAGDAFCKGCFRDYFVHKFRAMLGKNRCIYPGEKVLLAFSGGLASSSMLRQVQEGLNREAAKKLRFRPGIIYIDEGAVCGRSLDEREKTCRQVEAVLRATGFPYHLVFLEEVFDIPTSFLNSLSHSAAGQAPSYKEAVADFLRWQQHQQQREKKEKDAATSLEDRLAECSMEGCCWPGRLAALDEAGSSLASHAQDLSRLFAGVKSLTAKEELLQTLRTHLVLHVARRNRYTKVMVGDSCTRVSVKLLTNLSLGRGAFLAMDTGFLDSRYGDVLILRPMREYPAKEIAFYNYLFGVPMVFTPGLDTKASDRASIHLLIESFLCKLQLEFPSTVSTVYRTGEKLSAVPPEAQPDMPTAPASCLLCLCPLDTNVEDGSSLQATLLLEKLSQRPPAAEGCCGGGTQAGCRGEPPAGRETSQLVPLLCYGCRLTVKELSCVESLPPYIHKEAERQRCRAAMKQEIQEFLLEDDT